MGFSALLLVMLASTPPWRDPGQPPVDGDTATRLRVFFDLEAAHWTGNIVAAQQTGAFKLRSSSVGVFGYRRTALGFGLGWGINEWLVVGARGEFAIHPDSDAQGNAGLVRGGSFQPYVELLFARMRHVRPFVLGRAGIGGAAAFRHKNGTWSGQVSRTIVPSVGVGLGTHAFVNEDLSFDVAITFDYRWNMRPRAGAPPETFGRWYVADTNMIAAVVLGLSRWF